jgi:hypothetical protein
MKYQTNQSLYNIMYSSIGAKFYDDQPIQMIILPSNYIHNLERTYKLLNLIQ